LESESAAPLYLQLQRLLRTAIDRHVLAPDEALPPERDLAEAYKVSRVTVRKALDGLVQARLLTRRQGAGTFVAARVEKNFATISSFTEDMLSRGRQPHSKWLSRSEGTVMPEEALALGLSPGSPVYRLTRIRYADGQSMALEHATVPKPRYDSPADHIEIDKARQVLFVAALAGGTVHARAVRIARHRARSSRTRDRASRVCRRRAHR